MNISTTPPSELPVALTIAGSDSGAGAGIQADLLTFAALGVYGTTAVTCLTAQNPQSVSAVLPAGGKFVAAQLSQIADYFNIRALKTGMLFNVETIQAVCDFLQAHPHIQAVVDPVMVASSGAKLLQDDAINAYKNDLLPRAILVTPNLDEANVLLEDLHPKVNNSHELPAAARYLAEHYATAVLLKGGHLDTATLSDVLCLKDGTSHTFTHRRISQINTHGSGCTLSAAITAYLASGYVLAEAVHRAHLYLNQGMNDPLTLAGTRFINHFPHQKNKLKNLEHFYLNP